MSGRAEYPAVSRWRVRHALRQARDAKGLTQTEVAVAMEWSLSKVQRIELGEVNVSATDLRSVLDLLDITDPAMVGELLEEARMSRRERWVVDPDLREHLTVNSVQLLQFEAVADSTRWFQTNILPGILQTPAYTEAVLRFYDPEIDDNRLKAHLGARAQRRRTVLDRTDSSQLSVILYEPVLMMNVGGVDVMAEQLRDLAVTAGRPNVNVRVLPVSEGLLANVGSFCLLGVKRGVFHGELVYREISETDYLDDDPGVVNLHRRVFTDAWESALPQVKSVKRIVAEAAALEAS
ncbi:helix-turn-helix transcriptional regulator [Actinoplanes sp. NBRC 103695]|uniref:helix-turn-helix domain-containing protein n=1 Tax=Actinoplanes sp. NBRC 103695 TaxID=3032202 RepID=UPI0024A42DA0|nr:helix-turn-helix transcriptional regulator [Actinoplanes sp. NBRC 103695]GLZ00568.1 hypothetical protein Acsp02_78200 [Actinoplanes sp. NBRC 103695]